MDVQARAPSRRPVGEPFRLDHVSQRTASGAGAAAWDALQHHPLAAARLLGVALHRPQARSLDALVDAGVFELRERRENTLELELAQIAGGGRQRWLLRRDGDELSLTVRCEIADAAAFERFEHRRGRVHAYLRRRLLRDAASRGAAQAALVRRQ